MCIRDRMCIEAGVGSVEHGCYIADDPDLVNIMAGNNTFLTPTFEVYEFHSTVSAPHIIARTKELMQVHQDSMQMAIAAGVKISSGTDAGGFVHGDNAREIELMVERGLTNMQAIQTATGWAAECIGREKDFGTIAKGKYADFLVLDGDPLKDIGVFRAENSIRMVMKGGIAYVDNLPTQDDKTVSK